MTLHVVTRTPNHILTVSDRTISTIRMSDGKISIRELDDDRFKHVTLQTNDARAVISFAGFAGLLDREGKVIETTVDWLTSVLEDSMKARHYGIDQHLNNIRDQINKHVGNLRKKYPTFDLRLAILIMGWTGVIGFGCVIDNCIKERWEWEENARDSFTTRIRRYTGAKYKVGSTVAFLCNERLALKQRPLIRLLHQHAKKEDIEAMFNTSVQIIRAAAAISGGTIGEKCSGICISRNTPGFRALHDRVDRRIWTVIPNHVTSMSRLKLVCWNDEVHRPKPPAKLTHLVTPVEADTPRKRLAFWHRVHERLRLLHNEQGAKARNSKSRNAIDRFHEWQRKHFEPVNTAASNELNQAKSHMQIEDPSRYGAEVEIDTSLTLDKKFQMTSEGAYVTDWGPDLFDDPFLPLKLEDRFDTTWDKEFDLSDISPFSVGESNEVPISQDYLDELTIHMNEGLQLQSEGCSLRKETDELRLSEFIHKFLTHNERFESLIIRLMSLDCPEKYLKLRDYLLDFFTFTQASTYFYAFFIKARTVGLTNEARYFYGKSMDFHAKSGNALDLANEETKRLMKISKD